MIAFRHLHQPTGRYISKAGEPYLFFGGTAYLGLLDNPGYIDLYKKGIDTYGLNNGTSRSNNVQLGVYDEAEQRMASRFGFETAALLSSGYLAAQVAVRTLSAGKKVLYAPDAHPALWLEPVLMDERSFEDWRDSTIAYINASKETSFLIISNTLDNLTPRRYDFSPFVNLCDSSKHLFFILDDSHGIGIIHRDAISVDLGVMQKSPNIHLLIVASLAKGMGTDAGVVMGKNEIVQQVKANPIFRGASPPSPASVYALINGDSFYQSAFDRLHHNIFHLRGLLGRDSELCSISAFPVFTSRDVHLYRHLLHQRVVISSFPYPLSDSPLLNRIVVSALHEDDDLEYLAEVCLLKKTINI
ncbi:aminotransferase class I/II-fold pyridoxal phosphate-dependent enzyme [Sphingobacterium faecale]|uniref:Aminotransferase class I/II-fold pyridoxal phosphate-dependent enzyme n=1 Tax=Sphingobacterium faecale TaxID=2803775 RepID=A0ABS1R4J4_9SPHI|nr:aminotransferase class I/II-fold pyridoxal phosphate-dependent enzyme [Sphingobacterium faecale]MBL1409578.1 aminotransferase class I/II-fold pyridoxal phosphate-dependent enzyme [Sphingobacterium faecale]